MYLLPARGGRGMGMVMANGAGARSHIIVRGPFTNGGPVNPPNPMNPPNTILPPGRGPVGPVYAGRFISSGTGDTLAVPSDFPKNQIFVNADGSFWEWSPSQNAWMNVGTPYGTGTTATPPAPPPSPTGASTAVPGGTVAPAPVNVNIASAPSLYQEIFDWLQQSTTLLGMQIPNFVIGGAGAFAAYKFMGKR